MKKKVLAFTLAEVLITLSIIGIVASLTIPTLMADYQKHVYVAQLKKFYSVFQQGMRSYAASMGCTTMQCTGVFDTTKPDFEENLNAAIRSIFKVTKNCIPLDGKCIHDYYLLNKNGPYQQTFNDDYTFVTADGTMFTVGVGAPNCTLYSGRDSKLQNTCGYTFVDVNGDKKPNTYGRDIFYFLLGNDGILYPYNGIEYSKAVNLSSAYWKNMASDGEGCGTPGEATIASNNRGQACAARIMEEGWEMNY